MTQTKLKMHSTVYAGPTEKFLLKGQNAVSDIELISIMISPGAKTDSTLDLSRKIFETANYSLKNLCRFSATKFQTIPGIGKIKGVQLAAAIALVKRARIEEQPLKFKITSSKSVFEYMHPIIGDLEYEEFWVLYLNSANVVLHFAKISQGGLNATVVDIRVVLKTALLYNAIGIILCHNHPSETLVASLADKDITKKIKIAAKQMDIKVLDHCIITSESYFSFADEGLL